MLANNILLNNIFFLNAFQYLNINRQRPHLYLSSKSLMTLKTLFGNTIFDENFTDFIFRHFYETYWCQWDFFRRIIKSNDHIIFKWFNESNDIWINGAVFFIKFCIFLTWTYIQKPSKLILPSDEHHNWNTDITGLESEVSQPFDMLQSMFKGYSWCQLFRFL